MDLLLRAVSGRARQAGKQTTQGGSEGDGDPPAMTMAEKAARWQLRATTKVSPGPAQATTAACTPAVQPLTRNQVRAAPQA